MSASGTGIFDDDVACTIRTQYRACLKDGKPPAQATQAVLRTWRPALADAEDGPVIWLALAALQCQYGCLEAKVKAKALAVINNGSDLEHWRSTGDPKLVRSRVAVHARLRAKLEAPRAARTKLPEKPKRSRVPFREEKSSWPQGEVIAYSLLSGQYILMQVCGHFGSGGPIFAVLSWRGRRLPPRRRIQQLPYKKVPDPVSKAPYTLVFSVGRSRERELPQDRVVLGVSRQPVGKGDFADDDFAHALALGVRIEPWKRLVGPLGGYRCTRWRDLDRVLEAWLGWK